jgi:beta-phosphoglucomutase family hydrolase
VTIELPDAISAYLFDLDGVLTQTAKVHFKAWKQTFDEELQRRAGDGFQAFSQEDYNDDVDGKPRYDGVQSFMQSRGYDLPEDEIHRIGDRKNELVLKLIDEGHVEAYAGSVRFLQAARAAGKRTAVVSSSANCQAVIQAVDIERYLEVRVDGTTIEEEHLHGKPAPDSFLAAARKLGVEPAHAAVFEDALAGVEAGRAGHFGVVVGVDRVDHAQALSDHGATIVVQDLDELLGTTHADAGTR